MLHNSTFLSLKFLLSILEYKAWTKCTDEKKNKKKAHNIEEKYSIGIFLKKIILFFKNRKIKKTNIKTR
jgi:hypothetical protein